jgi:hypothetical protein
LGEYALFSPFIILRALVVTLFARRENVLQKTVEFDFSLRKIKLLSYAMQDASMALSHARRFWNDGDRRSALKKVCRLFWFLLD